MSWKRVNGDTITAGKTQASGTILEFVNSKIISGSWPSGEEQTFSLDSSALNQANELSAQATLSWEEGEMAIRMHHFI